MSGIDELTFEGRVLVVGSSIVDASDAEICKCRRIRASNKLLAVGCESLFEKVSENPPLVPPFFVLFLSSLVNRSETIESNLVKVSLDEVNE